MREFADEKIDVGEHEETIKTAEDSDKKASKS